jgi:MarR family transcriptional regulator for hemolysin
LQLQLDLQNSLSTSRTGSPSAVEISGLLMEVIPRAMTVLRTELRSRRGTGLTVPQFRVLIHLRKAEITNKYLAETLGVSVPSMSRLVAGLVERQLVCRTVTKLDRREFKLSLTPAGETLVSDIREKSIQDLAKKISSLDHKDQDSLRSAIFIMAQIFRS